MATRKSPWAATHDPNEPYEDENHKLYNVAGVMDRRCEMMIWK